MNHFEGGLVCHWVLLNNKIFVWTCLTYSDSPPGTLVASIRLIPNYESPMYCRKSSCYNAPRAGTLENLTGVVKFLWLHGKRTKICGAAFECWIPSSATESHTAGCQRLLPQASLCSPGVDGCRFGVYFRPGR